MKAISKNPKYKDGKTIPKKGKEIDGLIFSIRRVSFRDFQLFYFKMIAKRARYFKFKIKRHGLRFYTVLMAYK